MINLTTKQWNSVVVACEAMSHTLHGSTLQPEYDWLAKAARHNGVAIAVNTDLTTEAMRIIAEIPIDPETMQC